MFFDIYYVQVIYQHFERYFLVLIHLYHQMEVNCFDLCYYCFRLQKLEYTSKNKKKRHGMCVRKKKKKKRKKRNTSSMFAVLCLSNTQPAVTYIYIYVCIRTHLSAHLYEKERRIQTDNNNRFVIFSHETVHMYIYI